MFRKVLSAVATAGLVLCSAAHAQFGARDGEVFQSFSMDDVASILGELGIRYEPLAAAGPSVGRGIMSNGNVFIVQGVECKGADLKSDCMLLEMLVGFQRMTLPLTTINEFHRERSLNSMIIVGQDGSGGVAAKALAFGGITRLHMKAQAVRFFQDVDVVVNQYMRTQGNSLAVSLDPSVPAPFARSVGLGGTDLQRVAVRYSANGGNFYNSAMGDVLEAAGLQ